MLKKIIGIVLCILIIGLTAYGLTSGNLGLPILVILVIRFIAPFILKEKQSVRKT